MMEGRAGSTILMAAPRNIVMSVIADFPAYPGWAGVHSAEVVEPGAQGRARMVRFELAVGMFSDRFVLGYEWHGDELVRWELAEQGALLSALSGAYLLADRDAGTEVTFELAVGVRIPVMDALRRRAERGIIDVALTGLKSRAEALSGSPPG